MRAGAYPGEESTSANELRLPARPSELRLARDYARNAAIAFGFDEDDCYEFVYAVNEAVTNAIRHGSPDEQGSIRLAVGRDADRLVFTVKDFGSFVVPVRDDATVSTNGRGFALMANLVDEICLRIESSATIVTLSKASTSTRPEG